MSSALARINHYLVKITPIGVFAIVASIAGTMQPSELSHLKAYVILNLVASLVLGYGVLMTLLAALTPFSYRELFKVSRAPVITAFVTGKVFIVLPMLIESAEELSHQDLLALLEPWLGAGNVSDDLPVPAMIAVKITDGMRVDMRALAATLSAKAPGAQLDDHGDWLGHLLSLAAAMEAVSFSALFLIGLTTMAIVIFATEARLSSEQETIEVVHLIGAEDSMIAKAFLRRFLLHGARGALGGAVGGVICILSMGAFTSRFPSGLVPDLGLNMAQFMWLIGVPVAATLATGLMAYVTVLRRLRERL